MTPNELDGLELAFHREEARPDAPSFQVKVLPTGFLVNVHRDGQTVCYLGGSIMPTGTVAPWVVDSQNRKTLLEVIEHERMRDLVRRMIMAIPTATPRPTEDPEQRDRCGEEAPDGSGPCVLNEGHNGACEGDGGALCPGCREPFIGVTTTMGFVGGVDRNHATCSCGWKGRVNELIPTTPHPDDCACDDCTGPCELCTKRTPNLVDRFGSMAFVCEPCCARGAVGYSDTVH